jgi:hypothetical protein
MAEYNIQVRGWWVLVGILAVLGFSGATIALQVRSVDDEMRDAVRVELLNEYSGRSQKDVARILEQAREGLPIDPLPPMVQRDVQFTSIAARGRMGGPVTLVRAELTVDGGPPPDGVSIRYFRISRKFTGGWMVVGKSDSYSYFMALFP